MNRQIISTSLDQTLKIATAIGKNLRGGEVIELISDLGGGKTSFVRGLAKGMGSHDYVSSPSFTISQLYKADKLTLHHYDFYRLMDPGVIANELAEILVDPTKVVVIEWPDIIRPILPTDRLSLTIDIMGPTERQLNFRSDKLLDYLIQKVEI